MNQAEERQTKPVINTIQATRSELAFTDVSQHAGPQVLAITTIKIIYEDRKRFAVDRMLKGTLLGFGDDFFVMKDGESYLVYDDFVKIISHVPASMWSFDGCNPHGFCVKLGDGTMVTFNRFGQRTGNKLPEEVLMSLQNDSTDPGQSVSPLNWLDEEMRSGLINRDRQLYVTLHRYKESYGDVAVQEAEIREKIKIEIAFQSRLALAFDKEGYLASDVTDEAPNRTKKTSNGEGEENGPGRTLSSWQCFRVLSKDVTIPYWLTVWFFGDKEKLPLGIRSGIKEWRTLCGDDLCEFGSSKVKELEGMSFTDTTMPLCCHLLVKEERLRFETLPLPVMRATLLNGHLAEELASKVALAFDRIRAITVERGGGARLRPHLIQQRCQICCG